VVVIIYRAPSRADRLLAGGQLFHRVPQCIGIVVDEAHLDGPSPGDCNAGIGQPASADSGLAEERDAGDGDDSEHDRDHGQTHHYGRPRPTAEQAKGQDAGNAGEAQLNEDRYQDDGSCLHYGMSMPRWRVATPDVQGGGLQYRLVPR